MVGTCYWSLKWDHIWNHVNKGKERTHSPRVYIPADDDRAGQCCLLTHTVRTLMEGKQQNTGYSSGPARANIRGERHQPISVELGPTSTRVGLVSIYLGLFSWKSTGLGPMWTEMCQNLRVRSLRIATLAMPGISRQLRMALARSVLCFRSKHIITPKKKVFQHRPRARAPSPRRRAALSDCGQGTLAVIYFLLSATDN